MSMAVKRCSVRAHQMAGLTFVKSVQLSVDRHHVVRLFTSKPKVANLDLWHSRIQLEQ